MKTGLAGVAVRARGLFVVLALSCTWAQDAVASRKLGLVVHARDPSFNREAAEFARALQARGYATETIDVSGATSAGKKLRDRLEQSVAALASGDRVVLSLECHGESTPGDVYLDPNATRRHGACGADSGWLEGFAQRLVARGVEPIVFDNSCSGGATVELLERLGVCAVASVAPGLPSVTGMPSFSRALADKRLSGTFEDVALVGEAEILKRIPGRLGQKGYYSTASGLARQAAILRSAFLYAGHSLGDWDLRGSPIYFSLHPGQKDLPQADPRKTIDSLLRRSARFEEIFKTAMSETEARWSRQVSLPGAGSGDASRRAGELLAFVRRRFAEEGVTAKTALIPERLESVRMELKGAAREMLGYRSELARLLADWGKPGSAAGISSQILKIHEAIEAQTRRVSVLMAVSEFVEQLLDKSPCRTQID